MARISSYNYDNDLTGSDKVIGTDSGGQSTRNFSLHQIGKYLNKSGALAVARQVLFSFVEDDADRDLGKVFFDGGGTFSFASTTEVIVSKRVENGVYVDKVIEYGESKSVVIFNPYVLNDFAEYKVLLVEDWSVDSTFMRVVLSYVQGSGTWTDGSVFGFAFFKDSVDANYVHNQTTAASVWNVIHGMNKYPSVSITDSAGTVVHGEIDYVSLNEVTVTFKGSFKGKAIFN